MSDPHRGTKRPARPKPAKAPAGPVSRMCAEGKHGRCLGTVFVYPPVDGKRLVPCRCPVEDCGHGTEIEKARRR